MSKIVSDEIKSHTPPCSIKRFGIDTQAYWSLNPTGRLLVLVHGFNGMSGTTWLGLPQALILQTGANGYDIVSFGYDSVKQTASESANQLQSFLDKLFQNTTAIINRSLDDNGLTIRRAPQYTYSHVVLIGHSLGACVTRRALLNQIQSGRNKWNAEIRLVWFAPAHRGAKLKLLIDAVALAIPGGYGQSVDAAAKYYSPSLGDLDAGSEFLRELLEDTRHLCDAHPSLKAPITFWALRDSVVTNGPFAKDTTPFEEVDGANHVSICKPTGYDKRVGELLRIMSFQ